MNLQEARGELAGRGFDYLSASRMTIMLNNAKNAFEDAWPFPWLERTVTAAPPLLIADLKYVRMVKHVPTNDELWGLDFRQVAQDDTDLTVRGLPGYWWLEDGPDVGAILHVWPVATDQISVWYTGESPELVNQIDAPQIPARYHPIWIDYAVVQAYKDSDNFTGAQALQSDINGRMLQLIERFETRNRQNGHFTNVRFASEDD